MIQAELKPISKAEESILSELVSNGIDSEDSAISLRQLSELGLNIVTVQKYCPILNDYGLLDIKRIEEGKRTTFKISLTKLGSFYGLKSIIDESYKEGKPVKEVKKELDKLLESLPLIKQSEKKIKFYNTLRDVVYGTDVEFSFLNNAKMLGITLQLFTDSQIEHSLNKRLAITEMFSINEYFSKNINEHLTNVLTFSFYYDIIQKLENEFVKDTDALKHGNNKQLVKDRLKSIKKTRLEIIKIIKNSPEIKKINATIGGNYNIDLINSEKEKNA